MSDVDEHSHFLSDSESETEETLAHLQQRIRMANTAHVSGITPPQVLELGPNARTDWRRWKDDWKDYVTVDRSRI